MKRIMVRYKLKADRVEENKQLVKAIFEELNTKRPEGLRYASFGFPDGVSFVHIVSIETTDALPDEPVGRGKNPLSMTEAFPLFTKDIKDRCEEPPVAMDLTEVGSYNFF
jgi:hypothetical protein